MALTDALMPDDPTAQELARVRAQALRGTIPPDVLGGQNQQGLGQTMQIYGNVFGNKGLSASGADIEQAGVGAQEQLNHALQRTLAAQKEAATIRHQKAQEGISQQNVNRQFRAQEEQARHARAMEDRNIPLVQPVLGPDGKLHPASFNSKTNSWEMSDLTSPPKPVPGARTPHQGDMEWDKFQQEIARSSGRSRLEPKLQERLNAGERIVGLTKVINPGFNGEPGHLSPNQFDEVGAALGTMVMQGQLTEHEFKRLVPDSLSKDGARIWQYITGQVTDAGSHDLLHQMLSTVNAEGQVINRQMLKAQAESLPRRIHLRTENPEQFDSMLRGVGINPAHINEHGLLKKIVKVNHNGQLGRMTEDEAKATPGVKILGPDE